MATTGSSRTPGARPAGARRPAKRTGWRRFLNYPRRGKGPIRRWVPSWRIVVGAFLGVFALGTGVAVAAYATTAVPENLESVNDQVTTIYYSDGVTPITTIQNETRVLVDLSDLPDHVADAVIASEDSSFRSNIGVNPRGLARAMWTNLTTSGPTQGASTITQQFVERTKTDTEKSYLGKIREMIIAIKVNRTYTKDEVLGGYLNTIYWGRNVNGIGAASQAYFGKPAQDLTLSEAALLAGIIPSPNSWDPDKNPEMAEQRWSRVLDRMLDQGLITKAEREEATFPTVVPRPPASNTLGGQVGYIVDMVQNEIGDREQFADGKLRTAGLSVVTTIDKRLQDEAVAVAATAYQGDHPADPRLRVGLVSIDTATGELRAVYGGADYVAQAPPGGAFNFAMRGGAQGGSTFKPFTLLAALEDGHQLTERFDGKSQMKLPGWNEEGVGPRNFGGINYRNMNLVDATANSVNSVYAQLNMEIGPKRLVEVAHELGIPDPVKDPANPTAKELATPGYIDDNNANVLGTATVRPVDLATAYATLANGGYRVTPHVVAKVTDLKGNLVYEAETTPERTSFKPENIAGVTYAMTHVVTEGSGSTALELNRPVAGKTGTSNDNKSAWFAGFVPQLATVVGLMQEDENGLTTGITPFGQWSNDEITGSTFPARAWTDYMKVALDGVEVKDFPAYKMPRQSPSPTPSPTQEPTEETAPTEEAPPPDPRADWVTVPADLVGRQVGDAKKALEKLGLGVNTVAVVSNEPESTVVEVAFAGQQVPPGSQITLSVSKGSADGDDDGDGGTTGASPPPAPSSAPSQTADPDKKADPLTPPGTAGKG